MQSEIKLPYFKVILGYSALTLLMTYPLITVLSTHVPGYGTDDQQFIWNLWWARHSIVELKANPLFTDYMIIPHRSNLAMHSYVFLNGLLSVPLQKFLGLITISNMFLIMSFIATGLGTFLLAMYLTGDARAAFVAGAIFAFCSYKMLYISGHYNIMMSHWLPFYLLFLIRSVWEDESADRYALAAGIIFGLNYLTSLTYALFAAILTALFMVYTAATQRKRLSALARSLVITVIASLPLILPHLFYAIAANLDLETAGKGVGELEANADLLSFIAPPERNPVYGWLTRGLPPDVTASQAFVGFAPLAILAYGIWKGGLKGRIERFFLYSCLFFMVLALGVSVHVLGRDLGVPLPYALLIKVPKMINMRVPIRFIIPAMLCLSVLCAYGLVLLNRKGRFIWIAALALVLADGMAVQPTFDSRVPRGYEIIASDTDSESVMELPFFVASGNGFIGKTFMPVINYQRAHEKRIFGGFLARLSSAEMMYGYLNLPLVRAFIFWDSGHDVPEAALQGEKKLAAEVVDLFRIGYVVVHKAETRVTRDMVSTLTGAEVVYEDDDTVIMKTDLGLEGTGRTITAGTLASIPYLFEGWFNCLGRNGAAYALSGGESSMVLLNLTPGRNYRLSLSSFALPKAEGVRVSAYINDYFIGEFLPEEKVASYSFNVMPDMAADGVDRLRLVYDRTFESSLPFDSVIGAETMADPWPGGRPDIDTGPSVALEGLASRLIPWEHSLKESEGARLSIGLVKIYLEQVPQVQ